jgi:hypothetical protein
MREIREALTLDDNGRLPVKEEAWWDGMNMQPPDQAWRDMDIGQRYDLLLHAMDEAIWSLEPARDADGWRDSQKLALEFVQADDPQRYERFTQWDNRPIAAYDAEVAKMTRDGPGEESGLARAWPAASERGRLGLLADLAMEHGVEEEVFVRTARRVMGWPEPTAEQREAMADAWAYAEGVGMSSPEALQNLQAEWTHDYGLRRLEDRGLRYEDEAERTLDRNAARGGGQQEERLPSPGAIAQDRDGPEPPGSRRGKDRGR